MIYQRTLTSKGQITLPKMFRKSLMLNKGDTLLVEMSGDEVLLRKPRTPTIHELDATLPKPNKTPTQ